MKRITIIWILLGFICFVTTVNAQSGIAMEASQLYTSFKFTDSLGTKLDSEYSGILTGAYHVGYRFVSEGGLMVKVGLGMRKAAATLEYDAMNYAWDMKYVDGRLGLGYMLKYDKVSPYINVCGYYSYLLRGYQTINNENFDMKKAKSINDMDYGVTGALGVQFTLSYTFSTYVELNYLRGLNNLEKDNGQKASNLAYGLTLGVSYALSSK
jgi:hypothetical protein